MIGGNSATSVPNAGLISPYPTITQRQVGIAQKMQIPSTSYPYTATQFNPGPGLAFSNQSVPQPLQQTLRTSLVTPGAPTVIQTQNTSVVPTLIIPQSPVFPSVPTQSIFQPNILQYQTSMQQSSLPQTAMLQDQNRPQASQLYNAYPVSQGPPFRLSQTLSGKDSVIGRLDPYTQMTIEINQSPALPQGIHRPNLQIQRTYVQNPFVDVPSQFGRLVDNSINPPMTKARGIGVVTNTLASYDPTLMANIYQSKPISAGGQSVISNLSSTPIKDQFTMMKSIFDSKGLLKYPEVQEIGSPQPSQIYAKSVSQVPIIPQRILEIVKMYKQTRSTSSMDNLNYQRGTPLGPYYIPSKQAYYIGEWMNGLPCGYAKIIYDSNAYFEGFFLNGQAFCEDGLWVYSDGSYYIGDMYKSQPQGHGKMVYRNFDLVYTGEWSNGKPEGKGEEKFKDGARYEGEFKNGLKDGVGKFYWADGSHYEGRFQNGFMKGQGMRIDAEGNSFKGQFDKNLISGRGIYTTMSGQYKGEFLYNKRHGKGVFKYLNGDTYSGEFKDDYPNGHGKFYTTDGKTIQGIWEDGKNIFVSNVYDSNDLTKSNVSMRQSN